MARGDGSAFRFHEVPTLGLQNRPFETGERPLILVADDNDAARFIYAECFTSLGFRVVCEATGAAAVRTAQTALPDIIVMDLCMPDVDGIEATRQMKSDPRTRDSVVIVVTALGTAAFAAAREAGCDAFFCKPVDPYSLEDVLHTLLPAPGPRAITGEDEDGAGGIIKSCGCGRGYTQTEWGDLRLCGYFGAVDKGTWVELRTCVCGSTIGVRARRS